jgi:hypothetical protein
MDFWMQSIHSHAAENATNSLDNTTLFPPIFVVGTHRNSLHDDPAMRAQMVRCDMTVTEIRSLVE